MPERSPRYRGESVEEIVAEETRFLQEGISLETLTNFFSLDPARPLFFQRLLLQGATHTQATQVIDALHRDISTCRWSVIARRLAQMNMEEIEQCASAEQVEDLFGGGLLTPEELMRIREFICQMWEKSA